MDNTHNKHPQQTPTSIPPHSLCCVGESLMRLSLSGRMIITPCLTGSCHHPMCCKRQVRNPYHPTPPHHHFPPPRYGSSHTHTQPRHQIISTSPCIHANTSLELRTPSVVMQQQSCDHVWNVPLSGSARASTISSSIAF